MEHGILDRIKENVPNLTKEDLDELKKQLAVLDREVNILVVGPTGSGKSSTINALFKMDVASVGHNPYPETKNIQNYQLDNLTIWDSPGLGEGEEEDKRYTKEIIDLLKKEVKDDTTNANVALIDLVLLVVDGSHRDLGTVYKIVEAILGDGLGEKEKDRIIIGINRCDLYNGGTGFDYNKVKPTEELINSLNDMVSIIQSRISQTTGVSTRPIYYAANARKRGTFNVDILYNEIQKRIPIKKRMAFFKPEIVQEEVLESSQAERGFWGWLGDVVKYAVVSMTKKFIEWVIQKNK